jgi:hypothetical protein
MAPLELVQCIGEDSCGLVQLAHHIPLGELYGPGYGYLSGMNSGMKKHLEDIAIGLEGILGLYDGDVALDIGSNDGTLLKAYSPGIYRVGLDPGGFTQHYKDTDIIYTPSFFNREIYHDVASRKAKVITSIAMLYDLENPNLFVSDIKNVLDEYGIWVFEQSYLPSMLKNNAFDTICHEHVEYYGLQQINVLLQQHGLFPFHAHLTNTNGGSIMVYACHKENTKLWSKKNVQPDMNQKDVLLQEEEKYDALLYPDFIHHIEDTRTQLVPFLVDEQKKGKVIHVYGASTKGNVLLQYFEIDNSLVSYAAEKNPLKFGCMTPGTHIPIISMEESKWRVPDMYLVLPWHFRAGFIEQEKEFLRTGGRLVFPLPHPEVVSMENGEIVTRPVSLLHGY